MNLGTMTNLMVPSKRPRVPSFADKHSDYSETHAATTNASGWLKGKDVGGVEVNKFLDLCGFCKKKLRHDEDVFMYGCGNRYARMKPLDQSHHASYYFGAFCSKVCRTKQMACDMFKESSREIAKAKKGRMCEGIKAKDESKHEALENRDMISSPRFYI